MIRVETTRDATFQRAPGTLHKTLPYLSSGANTMERILVVEDDHAVQKALRRLFETEGFEIEISADGQSALEAFRRIAPAAIVLDLRLPIVSGRDVCREIKQQAPSVPIIVLSAASDVSDKVLLLELGADDYVTKPFSPESFWPECGLPCDARFGLEPGMWSLLMESQWTSSRWKSIATGSRWCSQRRNLRL